MAGSWRLLGGFLAASWRLLGDDIPLHFEVDATISTVQCPAWFVNGRFVWGLKAVEERSMLEGRGSSATCHLSSNIHGTRTKTMPRLRSWRTFPLSASPRRKPCTRSLTAGRLRHHPSRQLRSSWYCMAHIPFAHVAQLHGEVKANLRVRITDHVSLSFTLRGSRRQANLLRVLHH